MKYLAVALAVFINVNAYAAIKGAPFLPEEDQRFDVLENDSINQSAIARKYARAVYDVSIQGGGSTAHSLSTVIPAGSMITGIFVYIDTAFTKGGGGNNVGSLAIQCGGTRNLMDYVNISGYAATNYLAKRAGDFSSNVAAGYGQPISLVRQNEAFLSDGIASVPTACTVNAVVRGDSGYETYSAGKVTSVIEYFAR